MFDVKTHSKTVLKQSVFGHFLQRDDITCAYNALKIETIFFKTGLYSHITSVIGKPVEEALAQVPDGLRSAFESVLTKICNAHILVPAAYDELSYLKQVQKMAFHGPSLRVLVLHMTDYCNLRCRYCFIEGGMSKEYVRRDMSKETARASIDKFVAVISGRSLPKYPSVVFYGGEPLANWSVVEDTLEYIAQKQAEKILPERVDKILITNGTLVSPSIAATLKKFGVKVSVSVDGPKDVHDAQRITCAQRGSHEATITGFRLLESAGIQPTVSCVLSKDSLKKGSEIIRYLLDELGVKALGFNHVSIVPNVNDYDPLYEADFGQTIIAVQEIIQADYPAVYERRMNHKLNSFLSRQIIRADCTGCGEQMSVSPDGKIGICQGYMGSRKTFAGDVTDPKYFPGNDPVFIEWSHRSPLTTEACYDCPALATCGGGCPRNADVINGSIWKVDSAFCHFAKQAQEWMIWKKYDLERRE
ncbi:MAG TPA: radical SAM protein [Candidatus Saccharimonadales bacterium]|nr:radical SAM protein [Candidatus Saccharimonadales bacterium]